MANHSLSHEQAHKDDKTFFGFWVYLMTDLLMFAALFATFVVLRNNTFGGPSGHELFDLQYVLAETLLLLTSSFTVGLGVLAAKAGEIKKMVVYLVITFSLGLAFLGMELAEFTKLITEGNGPTRSGFLSSYFTLVGTHGAHILGGLVWLAILGFYLSRKGLSNSLERKITLFSYFWHFLDLVWIFIFTIVYLMS